MKSLSISGIILSIVGIVVSVINFLFFTLQVPGNNMQRMLPNGNLQIECYGGLEHHEHSITSLIVLCCIFMYYLFVSILCLLNNKARIK